MTIDSSLPKGFTLNMSHFVLQADKVEGRRYIVNQDTKLSIYVDSTYDLGYIFGAFVSVGISDIPVHYSKIGQVSFYTDGTIDLSKLSAAIKTCFNLETKTLDKSNGRKVLVIHNKAVARLLSEFGKKDKRHVPSKYIVNNSEYLKGIKDGIEDFNGHLPDTRKVINPRKLSPEVQNLHFTIKNWLNN